MFPTSQVHPSHFYSPFLLVVSLCLFHFLLFSCTIHLRVSLILSSLPLVSFPLLSLHHFFPLPFSFAFFCFFFSLTSCSCLLFPCPFLSPQSHLVPTDPFPALRLTQVLSSLLTGKKSSSLAALPLRLPAPPPSPPTPRECFLTG